MVRLKARKEISPGVQSGQAQEEKGRVVLRIWDGSGEINKTQDDKESLGYVLTHPIGKCSCTWSVYFSSII